MGFVFQVSEEKKNGNIPINLRTMRISMVYRGTKIKQLSLQQFRERSRQIADGWLERRKSEALPLSKGFFQQRMDTFLFLCFFSNSIGRKRIRLTSVWHRGQRKKMLLLISNSKNEKTQSTSSRHDLTIERKSEWERIDIEILVQTYRRHKYVR